MLDDWKSTERSGELMIYVLGLMISDCSVHRHFLQKTNQTPYRKYQARSRSKFLELRWYGVIKFEICEGGFDLIGGQQQEHANLSLDVIGKFFQLFPDQIMTFSLPQSFERIMDDPHSN